MEVDHIDLADPQFWKRPLDERATAFAARLNAGAESAEVVREIGEERVRNPRADITTALVAAEVDREKLTTAELASFFILLEVAGNETIRNAIGHGLHLLTQHPDQRARWQVGFGGPGPHFCLGAHLARPEIAVAFKELFRAPPAIHATGEPDRLLSSFIDGINHPPAECTPAGP
jgi:cytochrome P450